MVERARLPGVDFRYRIFNCDGDEVEQCGNGARCFAVFVREEGLTDKTSIRVETMKAVIEPEVRPDGRVTVNMGPARKAPEVLPFVPEGLESGTEGARGFIMRISPVPTSGFPPCRWAIRTP